ncbi:MAG TPA: C-type lectin domain-containing protein [Sphingomonadales bacterium]|nr:C-type lectin domain-containing protein [Sphingomonadales bacterium]
MNNSKVTLIFSLLFTIFYIPLSAAETGRKTPSPDGTVSAGPYYNPASKSYFELFRMQKKPGRNAKWFEAKALAEKQYFKNTRGRLAIIKDLDTHQFLLRNFSAKNYWIGLQYFCNTQTLKWVDGTDATRSQFTAWDTDWSNTYIRCGNMNYMPVHYTTATYTKALRWRASGPNKGYVIYLVEYPTGKE